MREPTIINKSFKGNVHLMKLGEFALRLKQIWMIRPYHWLIEKICTIPTDWYYFKARFLYTFTTFMPNFSFQLLLRIYQKSITSSEYVVLKYRKEWLSNCIHMQNNKKQKSLQKSITSSAYVVSWKYTNERLSNAHTCKSPYMIKSKDWISR